MILGIYFLYKKVEYYIVKAWKINISSYFLRLGHNTKNDKNHYF